MTGLAAQAVAVTRAFGHFVAVDHIDLEVHPGEVVGLLGANGAGKTTLIRLLLGLLRPTGGEIRLFGEPPSRGTRRRIGYVPQGLGLYDDLTPAENLAFSAAVFGEGSAAASLPEPLRRYGTTVVGSLPLGIQRTVAFAQALAHRPDLLVLDEPTSGVDPLARARLWETVAGAAAAGAGVLVTTHYIDKAGECDRLVIMAAGRVVARGTVPEIVGDAQVSVVESGTCRGAGVRGAGGGGPACRPGRAHAAGPGRGAGRRAPCARGSGRHGDVRAGHPGRALLPAHPVCGRYAASRDRPQPEPTARGGPGARPGPRRDRGPRPGPPPGEPGSAHRGSSRDRGRQEPAPRGGPGRPARGCEGNPPPGAGQAQRPPRWRQRRQKGDPGRGQGPVRGPTATTAPRSARSRTTPGSTRPWCTTSTAPRTNSSPRRCGCR